MDIHDNSKTRDHLCCEGLVTKNNTEYGTTTASTNPETYLSKHNGSDTDLSHCSARGPVRNHAASHLHPNTGYIKPLSRSRLKKLKLQYMRGHLRIIENPNINQLIRIEKDRIPKQYNFDQPYKMVIKSLSK